MRISLFGPPGAGKGTQAALLARRRGMVHVSTGEIIRTAIKDGVPLGRKAKSYVNEGRLVPDPIVRTLAEEALTSLGLDNFVLDGYPRTLQQAEWLTLFLEKHDAPLHAVLSLEVPDDVIVQRLSQRRTNKLTGENYHLEYKPPPPDVDPSLIIQRKDDRPDAIRKRLRVYAHQTKPVKEYYEQNGLLVQVDGVGDFEAVYARIVEVLELIRLTENTI